MHNFEFYVDKIYPWTVNVITANIPAWQENPEGLGLGVGEGRADMTPSKTTPVSNVWKQNSPFVFMTSILQELNNNSSGAYVSFSIT